MALSPRARSITALATTMLVLIAASASAVGHTRSASASAILGSCDPLSISTAVDRAAKIQLHCVTLPGVRLDYAILTQPQHGTLSLTPSTGQVIYTPAPGYAGLDSFRYGADRLGEGASATVSIGVGRASPTPGPVLTNVAQSHSSWREGRKLASISRRRPPIGTTFSFDLDLDQRASVSFAFTQQLAGRKVNGRCLAQTGKNARRPACKRTVTSGTLLFRGHGARNKVLFQGRLARGGKLALGRYTLLIRATNAAGKQARPGALRFTIVG